MQLRTALTVVGTITCCMFLNQLLATPQRHDASAELEARVADLRAGVKISEELSDALLGQKKLFASVTNALKRQVSEGEARQVREV